MLTIVLRCANGHEQDLGPKVEVMKVENMQCYRCKLVIALALFPVRREDVQTEPTAPTKPD